MSRGEFKFLGQIPNHVLLHYLVEQTINKLRLYPTRLKNTPITFWGNIMAVELKSLKYVKPPKAMKYLETMIALIILGLI